MTQPSSLELDKTFMNQAIIAAEEGANAGEIPIGCVITLNDHVIASAHNTSILSQDPSAHAEINALRAACQIIGNHRLLNANLYVTLEPCLMCIGAMIQARIKRLIFAAQDERIGPICQHQIHNLPGLNHRLEITQGIMEERAQALLRTFFRSKR